jgi:hypothetical protein
MKKCSNNSDCRGAYQCIDMSGPNPWGAAVLDPGARGKVCALPPPLPASGDSAVCSTALPPIVAPAPLDAGSDAASP